MAAWETDVSLVLFVYKLPLGVPGQLRAKMSYLIPLLIVAWIMLRLTFLLSMKLQLGTELVEECYPLRYFSVLPTLYFEREKGRYRLRTSKPSSPHPPVFSRFESSLYKTTNKPTL